MLAFWLFLLVSLTGAAMVSLNGRLGPKTKRQIARVYVSASVLTIATILLTHVAFPGASVSRAARHMEFLGVSVAVSARTGPAAAVHMLGEDVGGERAPRSFRWFALHRDARIDLQPENLKEGRPTQFRILPSAPGGLVYASDQPRAHSLWWNLGHLLARAPDMRCVNPTVGPWVATGQKADYSFSQDGGTPVKLTLKNFSGEVQVASSADPSTRPVSLARSLSLRDLLVRAEAPQLLRELEPMSWHEGESVLDSCFVVRSFRGDTEAEVGIVDPWSKAQPNAPYATVSPDGGRLELQISRRDARHTVRVGLDPASSKTPPRMAFRFDPPLRYAMPPAEVLQQRGGMLQLASTRLGQPENGYVFDVGNPAESFITGARLQDSPLQMKLSGGKTLESNREQRLGEGSVAPLVSLSDPVRATWTGWPWMLLALLAGYVACMGAIARINEVRVGIAEVYPVLVVWVVACAMLAVRAVLSFRVSALPPMDAASDYARVFAGTMGRAFWPMVTVPPALGIVAYLAIRARAGSVSKAEAPERAQRLLGMLGDRPWATLGRICFALALLLGLIPIVRQSALLGVLLVVLGLVFQGVAGPAGQETSPGPASERLASIPGYAAWSRFQPREPLLWLAAFLLVLHDPGTLILFLPLAVASAASGILASVRSGRRAPVSWGVWCACAACTLVALVAAPQIGRSLLTLPGPSLGAAPYRMAAVDADRAEDLLLDPATARGGFDSRQLFQTLHQRWQTLSYLRAGGAGYFESPLRNSGMSYPTMLSDASYAVFLVGEHGRAAGVFAIALILLMAFALFQVAWQAGRRPDQGASSFGLYAVGAMLGTVALYMALANYWAVPFTGQNVPFLGLNSGKEVLLTVSLLFAAVLLVAFPRRGGGVPARPLRTAWVGTAAWVALPLGLALGWCVLVGKSVLTTGPSNAPYNLSPRSLEALQAKVDQARSESPGAPLSETQTIRSASPWVRDLARRYDQGNYTATPIGQGRGSVRLTVDPFFFRQSSPFEKDEGVAWRGRLLAEGSGEQHRLVFSGRSEPVSLEADARPAELFLGRPVKAMRASAIDLKQEIYRRGASHTVVYGGPRLENGKVVLHWKTYGKPGRLWIDDQPAPSLPGGNEIELRPGQTVTLDDGQPGGKRLRFFYPGPSGSALAATVWRNGKYRRTLPLGDVLPLAATLGRLADDVQRTSKTPKLDAEYRLSIDLDLQEKLQTELQQWSASMGRPLDKLARINGEPEFTALAIMDSATGRLRSLASVPQRDPLEEGDAEEFGTEEDTLRAGASSWCFVNQTVGSSVKPLTFSALASQLGSSGHDISTLHVSEQAAVVPRPNGTRAYRRLGDFLLPYGRTIGGRERPRPDVDMSTYLRDSRTWPAIVTATIGLVNGRDPAQGKRELAEMFPPGHAIKIDGKSAGFTPRAALTRVFEKGRLVANSTELADSAFFRGIAACYGPGVVPFNYDESMRWDDGLTATWLPFDFGASQNQTLLRLGLPDLHRTSTTDLTDLDLQLVRYMFGGGECKWNAVSMATNAARIMTGMAVSPTLRADAKPVKTPMPAPISDAKWRQAHLLDPLLHITTLSTGDAVRQIAARAGYRIAMKTGTIDDGASKRARESEMLMFTVGRYGAEGFVPGHCISGFLSVRSAKEAEGGQAVKGELARRIMPLLVEYLKRKDASGA